MDAIRQRRLQSDFEKVRQLVAHSGGTLLLVGQKGSPPQEYTVEYHCPGLVQGPGGLKLVHTHRVALTLTSNYPMWMPTARMLTPAFNPHIFSSGDICLGGAWSFIETLDTLILRIGALIQLDPKVLNFSSPANHAATHWAWKNRSSLPLGRVSFRAPAGG